MLVLKLSTFGGEQPRYDIADVEQNTALLSENTNLYSGDLIPYKGIKAEKELSEQTKSVFPFVNPDGSLKWTSFNYYSKIVKSQFDGTDQRIFISQKENQLKTTNYTLYPEILNLGCPRPQIAADAILGGGGTGTALSTLYVYTFVNNFGEESAPSDPSPAVLKKDGQLTLVKTEDVNVPEGYKLEKKRIYRSVATGDTANYFFLAEVPISQLSYVDTKLNENLGETLSTNNYVDPASNLTGLIVLPNGIFVGHTEKELYFSDPYIAYSFPLSYMLSIPEKIVGICPTGGPNTFAVLTDGNPYICYGDTPNNMRLVKLSLPYPCVDYRSIVDMGFGCMYASYNGLVVISGNSQPKLVTEKSHSKETFGAVIKNGMNSFSYNNKYIGVCDLGCLVYDTENPNYVSRIKRRPQCGYYLKEEDKLFMVINGHLVQYDASESYNEEFRWFSKTFRYGDYLNYGAFRVLGDFKNNMATEESYLQTDIDKIAMMPTGKIGIGGRSNYRLNKDQGVCILEFWRDNNKFIARRFVTDDTIRRLPKTYKDDNIIVKITSNIRIREFHLGATPLSLKSV